MSSPISTPAALSSELRRYRGKCWRVVEAQHRVSTAKLVDTLAEQKLIEDLLEESKPPVPPECRRLDYLLSTPFRYGSEYPKGSRFRRAGRTPGVYYAAEAPQTAIVELAFHRLLFYAESPDTPWPVNAAELSAFSATVATSAMIDLSAPPLVRQRALWIDPVDYEPCQKLAENFRDVGGEIIRYESVRAAHAGVNIAVLACKAFEDPAPLDRQTWRMQFASSGIRAICEFPNGGLELGRDAFMDDPRMAEFDWDRG